jgi:hypothetical protein
MLLLVPCYSVKTVHTECGRRRRPKHVGLVNKQRYVIIRAPVGFLYKTCLNARQITHNSVKTRIYSSMLIRNACYPCNSNTCNAEYFITMHKHCIVKYGNAQKQEQITLLCKKSQKQSFQIPAVASDLVTIKIRMKQRMQLRRSSYLGLQSAGE